MSKELDEYRTSSLKELEAIHGDYCKAVAKEFGGLSAIPEKELLLSDIIRRLTDVCLRLHFECMANRDKIHDLEERLNV